MMTENVLRRYLTGELTIDDVRLKVIVQSHLEALAEVERLGEEVERLSKGYNKIIGSGVHDVDEFYRK